MMNQNRRQFVVNANRQINDQVLAYRARKNAAKNAAFAQSYRDQMISKGLIRPAGDAKIVEADGPLPQMVAQQRERIANGAEVK